MKKFALKKAIMACALLLSQASVALAAPSAPSFVQDAQLKKQIVRIMQHQFERHQKMSLDEIRADMIQSMEKNRTLLKERGQLTTPICNAMETAQTHILSLTDKEQILALEKEKIESTMTAGNFLFAFTRELVDSNSNSLGEYHIAWISFWSPLTVALDLAFLPCQFIASLVTGF